MRENEKDDIEKLVESGLEQFEQQDLLTRKEFLNEVKRHAIGVWKALVKFLLDTPEGLLRDKNFTTPSPTPKTNRRLKR